MYKRILIPVDTGENSSWTHALPVAVELAKTFGAKLSVMTVAPDMHYPTVAQFFPEDANKKMLDGARQSLDQLVEGEVPNSIDCEALVSQGTVYDEILRTAKDVSADLIVMASHRPDLSDYMIGPNAARVVRHADISVMVVRGQG